MFVSSHYRSIKELFEDAAKLLLYDRLFGDGLLNCAYSLLDCGLAFLDRLRGTSY